ncbi:MAG TPA: exodeoxyribonuclease VII small subunit [Sedimentisphaerales bacterium]|nr:exodeoxyribonuclease VII small subunit [Sedimentisphaerales bacterium]
MAKNEEKNDIAKLSFEEAIKTLTEIVTKIEQGQIPLEASLEQYEKGMSLIRHCRGILQAAEKRIDKIARQPDGTSTEKNP